ncbi:MAG: hypothetical protein N3A38_02405 [Planctomycetota bacterium]|nr:hypothetical protein [Planctomycetota bacterium]
MAKARWTTGQVVIIAILVLLFGGVIWKLLWGVLHLAANLLIFILAVLGIVWLVRAVSGDG